MQKTIDVSIPHQLGRDQARARLKGGAEQLRSQFGGKAAQVTETWNDYHADIRVAAMGQTLTGRLEVEENAIKISVDVPWMLAMIADKVRGRIEQEGRKLLAKK